MGNEFVTLVLLDAEMSFLDVDVSKFNSNVQSLFILVKPMFKDSSPITADTEIDPNSVSYHEPVEYSIFPMINPKFSQVLRLSTVAEPFYVQKTVAGKDLLGVITSLIVSSASLKRMRQEAQNKKLRANLINKLVQQIDNKKATSGRARRKSNFFNSALPLKINTV